MDRRQHLDLLAAGSAVVLVFSLVVSPTAQAVDSCKAKIRAKDGTIFVRASNVVGTLRWGESQGGEVNLFSNGDTCIQNGRASNCTLGAEGTADRVTPPQLCTIHLTDDQESCAAFLKRCTPGIRELPQGPAGLFELYDAGDNLLGQVLGTAHPFNGFQHYDVYIPTLGRAFSFHLRKDESTQLGSPDIAGQGQVHFENSDCTGQAYVELQSTDNVHLFLADGIKQNATVTSGRLFSPQSELAAPVTVASRLRIDDVGCDQNGLPKTIPQGAELWFSATEVLLPFPFPILTPLRLEPSIP